MAQAKDEQWKDRYLRSLDDLEQKEKKWQQIEDLLRRAIGRLAHAGYGIDPQLDKQLDRVREAVRSRRDSTTLDRLVRDASESAVQAHEDQHRSAAEAGQLLVRMLEGAGLAGARKRKAERLRKELETVESPARIPQLLTQAAEFIAAGTPATAEAPPPAVETQPERRGGLLGRLLGTKEETPAAAGVQPQQVAHALEQFLDRIRPGATWEERLADLRRQVATSRDETEAYGLLDQTAAIISEVLEVAERAGPDSRVVVETLPSAGEALLELLQKLDIPQRLQDRLAAVKSSLAHAATPQQLQLAVEAIADLMEAIRREVQKEKLELERFLKGVTDRIRHLSENLADLDANRDASSSSRAEFQKRFRDSMASIRDNVRESDDVEHLKQAIVAGLDAIESQMDDYVRREDGLSKAAAEKIDDLSRRLHDMKHEAFELQQKMAKQRSEAMKDPLTGVFNRLAYEEKMESEMGRWRRYGEPLSLLVLDIDHFKRINDGFGHLAGDKALKALAVRLAQNVREVDTVARYGGEEFVVIMPSTDAAAAFQVAEKLRSLVEAAGFHYNDQPVRITISLGVSQAREGDDHQDLFKRADDALYEAKQGGRNRSVMEAAVEHPDR